MNISQILTKLKSLVYSKSEADTLLSSKASSSHKHTKSEITDFPTIPTKTSQLTNDSGFLTSHQSLSNYSTLANTVKSLSISGKTITVTPGSGNAYTLTTQDTNTTYSNFVKSGSGAAAGLVPAPSTTAGTTKYLREDGTWQVPPDHTYTVNNATLTIQKNGTTVNSFTANASSNVTANITVPTKTSELTNDSGYITSSSNITGTAATATKLATARSISAGDLEFQGSANFDGSGNIKLNITHHRSLVTVGTTNNYPFHRIAYTAQETGNYIDRAITFFVGKEYISAGYGICRIVLRTNQASSGATAQCEVQWLVRTSGIPVDTIQVGFNNTAAASYVDVFYKSTGSWHGVICRVMSHASSKSSVGQGFTVVSTSAEVSNTTTSDPLTSTESYATIAAAGTKIRGKAYTSTITASDAGIANYATYNANGKELVDSIIKGLSVSGRTITYTKLDGSTGTITTQDTTYTIPTKTSQLTNDSGFLTSHQSLANYLTKTTNVSEMGRYIDMHYDNATAARNFDVRLQAASQGTGDGGGQFKIEAASVYTPNNLYLGSYCVYVG